MTPQQKSDILHTYMQMQLALGKERYVQVLHAFGRVLLICLWPIMLAECRAPDAKGSWSCHSCSKAACSHGVIGSCRLLFLLPAPQGLQKHLHDCVTAASKSPLDAADALCADVARSTARAAGA